MIKEEYVQYETAKLLKDAGFPQDGLYCCGTQGYKDGEELLLKPTQAQAMRWLRDDMKVIITPVFCWDGAWKYRVESQKYQFSKTYNLDVNEPFPTYEAAAEAGIQAACEYLIEKKNAKKTMKQIYTKCSTMEEATELSIFIMGYGYEGVYNDSNRYNDVAIYSAYRRNIEHHNECIFVGVNGGQLVIQATKRQMRKCGSLHYIRKERVFKELLKDIRPKGGEL